MTQSVMEQVNEKIDDTAHRASRAASAVVDAIEDGVGAARRVAKQGTYAASDLLDETKRCVQRHPLKTVVAVFAAGITAGSIVSWIKSRNRQ